MRILTWNMGAAVTFRGEKHARAWAWLNEQDVDVALLQETVPPENRGSWDSVVFQNRYPGKDWGCAVLVREGAYEQWMPDDTMPWLGCVGGAVTVARPSQAPGLWFASVHSDSSSFESTNADFHAASSTLVFRLSCCIRGSRHSRQAQVGTDQRSWPAHAAQVS